MTATSVPAERTRQWGRLPAPARVAIAVVVPVLAAIIASQVRSSTLFVLTDIAFWATVAAGLNIVVGYAGQLNLANGAFLALGAYVGTLGTGFWGWPGYVSLVVAGVAAYAVSTLISFVIFRAKSLHFALLTAGLSFVTYGVLVNWTSVTGGHGGLSTAGPLSAGGQRRPLTLGPLELISDADWFVVLVAALCLLLLATTFVLRRRTGDCWKAIHEDELLAASLGIRVGRVKRQAFVSASVVAAVSGVLFAHWIGFISPDAFSFAHASFEPVAMLVIGGTGTIAGPVIGAALVVGLPEILRGLEGVATLIYGLLLLTVVLVAPSGVTGLVRAGVGRLHRRPPARGRAASSSSSEEAAGSDVPVSETNSEVPS